MDVRKIGHVQDGLRKTLLGSYKRKTSTVAFWNIRSEFHVVL